MVNYLNTGGRYNPSTDTWTATSTTNAPSVEQSHSSLDWQRNDRLGRTMAQAHCNTGGRYNPGTDSWTATSTTNAPAAPSTSHGSLDRQRNDRLGWTITASYVEHRREILRATRTHRHSWTANPCTDTATRPSGARYFHTAVWTGSEMIVWGGLLTCGYSNTGGRYNPGTDSWTATSTTNAPAARNSHTAVWTGSEMIVWGGLRSEFSSI